MAFCPSPSEIFTDVLHSNAIGYRYFLGVEEKATLVKSQVGFLPFFRLSQDPSAPPALTHWLKRIGGGFIGINNLDAASARPRVQRALEG